MFAGAIVFGASVLRRWVKLSNEEREDFNIIQTSTLTLLALLIGFTPSMAVNRYDQRKNFEENEANAIGTEYARADVVDPSISARIKTELVHYAQLRREHFRTREPRDLVPIDQQTAQSQTEL